MFRQVWLAQCFNERVQVLGQRAAAAGRDDKVAVGRAGRAHNVKGREEEEEEEEDEALRDADQQAHKCQVPQK